MSFEREQQARGAHLDASGLGNRLVGIALALTLTASGCGRTEYGDAAGGNGGVREAGTGSGGADSENKGSGNGGAGANADSDAGGSGRTSDGNTNAGDSGAGAGGCRGSGCSAMCEPGTRRCDGNVAERCENERWTARITCGAACAQGRCVWPYAPTSACRPASELEIVSADLGKACETTDIMLEPNYALDREDGELRFETDAGDELEPVPHVAGPTECFEEPGWYFGLEASDHRIVFCPATCSAPPAEDAIAKLECHIRE